MTTTRSVPTFKGLVAASPVASRAKRHNRSSDTLHELRLRRELWRLGLRFRKNVKKLPGKPDIVFSKARALVFCDGDFWHGRNWRALRKKLLRGTNASYWSAKIATNVRRDHMNTALLKKAGWHVIRLWETEIRKNPLGLAAYVQKIVAGRQGRTN
jgi:DNA mismatch endonuclease, patch repair protein